jgi:hypothetical protein
MVYVPGDATSAPRVEDRHAPGVRHLPLRRSVSAQITTIQDASRTVVARVGYCHGDAPAHWTDFQSGELTWRCDMNATPVGPCKVGHKIAAAAIAQSNAEHYRAHASECKGIAECWSDAIKRQYEELARQWLVLAEHAATQD